MKEWVVMHGQLQNKLGVIKNWYYCRSSQPEFSDVTFNRHAQHQNMLLLKFFLKKQRIFQLKNPIIQYCEFYMYLNPQWQCPSKKVIWCAPLKVSRNIPMQASSPVIAWTSAPAKISDRELTTGRHKVWTRILLSPKREKTHYFNKTDRDFHNSFD